VQNLDLLRLRDLFLRENVLLCFNGPFSHSIIEELGKALKAHLEVDKLAKSAVMDVFSVFIEQTQNVRNYTKGSALPETARMGIVAIGKEGERYVVGSGNLVKEADIRELTARIDRLNGLDKPALKSLYKEQLRSAPEGPGAGLGLISMARVATAPLRYAVEPVGDDLVFFSLGAVI
jgi:hypothetical protein